MNLLEKEKTLEFSTRIQNLHKELECTRVTHEKNIQDKQQEIEELNAVIQNLREWKIKVIKNSESETTKEPSNENFSHLEINFFQDKDGEKTLHLSDSSSLEVLNIYNLNDILPDNMIYFNEFLEKSVTKSWKELSLESRSEHQLELHNFIGSLISVLPFVSQKVSITGFNIDSTSLKQLIESIQHTKKFSLIDCWLDIKETLSIDFPEDHNLEEFELVSIKANENNDKFTVEEKAEMFINTLKQASFFSQLKSFTISKNTDFDILCSNKL